MLKMRCNSTAKAANREQPTTTKTNCFIMFIPIECVRFFYRVHFFFNLIRLWRNFVLFHFIATIKRAKKNRMFALNVPSVSWQSSIQAMHLLIILFKGFYTFRQFSFELTKSDCDARALLIANCVDAFACSRIAKIFVISVYTTANL